jgi:hypothetical protein
MNQINVFLAYFGLILFCPIGSIIYVIAPKSKVFININIFSVITYSKMPLIQIGSFMSLPFIKFYYYTISYLIFICLILISSFQNIQNIIAEEKLSIHFSEYYDDFNSYVNNKNLTYRFPVYDFCLRKNDVPNIVDILICIMLLGN